MQGSLTKGKPTSLFVDPNLVKRVKSKVNAIAVIKESVKKDLKGNYDIRLLQETVRGMVEMENVDFKLEISRVQEKIKLLVEVKTAIDNESHIKQSIEFLEGLYSRICDQEDQAKTGNKFAHLVYRISYHDNVGVKTHAQKSRPVGQRLQEGIP